MELKITISPENYGTTSGQGEYEKDTTVSLVATPNAGKRFVAWYLLNGNVELPFSLPAKLSSVQEFLSNKSTYSYLIEDNTHLIAEFRDEYIFTVNASTSPQNVGSVYKSAKTINEGGSVTLRAREEKGYTFSHWSNGSIENPLTLSDIDKDINLVAYYTKIPTDNSYYLYRAFVKDQLALNSLPKAFLTINSFNIKRDLLMTSNSEFTVYELPSNIDEGDIFVLYNPQGQIMYYGIISSIEDLKIQTSQIQSFYKDQWVYDTHPSDNLETEIQYLLNQFANGYQKGSSYQDLLIKQEKAPLTIKVGSATSGQLETKKDNEVMDMESFIYDLYASYGLIFDFEIPYGSWAIGDENGGSVTIRKPHDGIIKIGDNAECIQNMSPTTEIEQTNRLIVYSSKGVYRTTYIATTNNGIVEEPSTIVGRFGATETKVVFSDDELETIKQANISEQMYNHKVTFNLILDNYLYNFWDWELGQSLKIYNGSDYYDSIFTGYELSKEEGLNPTTVKITAGKVRTSLVAKLKKR